MWELIIAAYVVFQIGFVLVVIVMSRKKDRRYKRAVGAAPEGYEPTRELYVDPSSGVRSRVYYNPLTGERLYVQEDAEN